jgi:hypothetical protein
MISLCGLRREPVALTECGFDEECSAPKGDFFIAAAGGLVSLLSVLCQRLLEQAFTLH